MKSKLPILKTQFSVIIENTVVWPLFFENYVEKQKNIVVNHAIEMRDCEDIRHTNAFGGNKKNGCQKEKN